MTDAPGWRDVPATSDFISPRRPRPATPTHGVNILTDKQIPLRSVIRGRGIDLAARVSAFMLRVITERQGDRCRLDLHGTLGGEWVRVLEQHWRSIKNDVPSTKVTVVLSNVDFIDPDGEQLLHRMADADVEFVVAGCLNRYVIESLKPGVPAAQRGRR